MQKIEKMHDMNIETSKSDVIKPSCAVDKISSQIFPFAGYHNNERLWATKMLHIMLPKFGYSFGRKVMQIVLAPRNVEGFTEVPWNVLLVEKWENICLF